MGWFSPPTRQLVQDFHHHRHQRQGPAVALDTGDCSGLTAVGDTLARIRVCYGQGHGIDMVNAL